MDLLPVLFSSILLAFSSLNGGKISNKNEEYATSDAYVYAGIGAGPIILIVIIWICRVLRCLSRDRSCPQRQAVRQTTVVVEGSYSVDPTNPSMPNHPEGGHVLHHVGVQGIHHGAQGLEEQPSVPYNSNDKRSECQPQHPPPPYEETSPSERSATWNQGYSDPETQEPSHDDASDQSRLEAYYPPSTQ